MKSPINGKEMKLVLEPRTFTFRKEAFEIRHHYYLCAESQREFTDDALDEININQAHNQYRERFGIPFPEQIRQTREKYGIAASKMSEILGFGTNSYRLYESGEVPSVANGRLILAVMHPKNFINQVYASTNILSEKERNQLVQRAEALLHEEKQQKWDALFSEEKFFNDTPNEYSGYRKVDFTKVAHAISYFSEMKLYKTKLNKLLFYLDFGGYKQTGFSVTGITYRAIQMGPVPAEYERLYMMLSDEGKISIHPEVVMDNYAEVIEGELDFDESIFDELELEVLRKVKKTFRAYNTRQMIDASHQECAWQENQGERALISYKDYAFDLKNLN